MLALLTAGLAVALLQGPRLYDRYAAAQYMPTTEIRAVNTALALTDEGERLLYASHPVIEDQQAFNDDCQSTERTAAMLGCYYQRKIFLFNVQNAELQGVVEVTAAHEMLHAAYDRLNFLERPEVDKLIRAEYNRVKDDETIKSLMEYYERAQPGSDSNELHSIIGTTVRDISPELEKYYARYFTNRKAIVEMNARYNAVFDEIKVKAEQLSADLSTEGERITSELASYEADQQQLQIDITTFNQRASNGDFPTRQSFESARSTLVRRSNLLNTRRENLNARIAAYNQRIAELNALSVKAKELNKSINGVPEPATGL